MTQGLFANQRETNLTSTIALIEEVLRDLGHDPKATRTSDDAWRIAKGSAVTEVRLVSRSEATYLRACAVVLTTDGKVDRPALYEHLLGLNATLCGAAFATEGNRVLLLSERATLDLDASEVRELIRRVTTYADDHDDVLVARFGGRMGDAS